MGSRLNATNGTSIKSALRIGSPPIRTAESPSSILIRNAAMMITADPARGEGPLGVLRRADVRLVGTTIDEVGTDLDPGNALILDATDRFVLPGFVDVHNHLWQSLIRGGGSELDLLPWLEACVYSMADAGITPEEAYAATRFSSIDLINTGVTTVVDHSPCFTEGFAEGNLLGLLDSGLRFAFAYCGAGNARPHIEHLARSLIEPSPLADLQIGAYPSMTDVRRLSEQVELARGLGCPLNIHLHEHRMQRRDRSFAAMEASGAEECRIIAAHAIHLTDDEIEWLAAHSVRVAHCPLSNMRLASGIMRMERMRSAGVQIGLGLDGGANDTSDVFANMKAAVGLQRAAACSPSVPPTIVDVLQMATIDGARALDMDDRIGSITPGKLADIIIINPNRFNFGRCWSWVSQIVLNGSPVNVETVIVNGRPLKLHDTVLGDDHEEIMRSTHAAALKARAAAQAAHPELPA